MGQNLALCPVCSQTLLSTDTACPRCNNPVVADEYLIDLSERREFKNRLDLQRCDWSQFKQFLIDNLKVSGEDWKAPLRWRGIWSEAEPLALKLQIGEAAAVKLAQSFWNEIEDIKSTPGEEADKTGADVVAGLVEIAPPQDKAEKISVELSRWVSSLIDGTWDVIAWTDFMLSLGQDADPTLLERQRDVEIEKQFPLFETVSVNQRGDFYDHRKLRARRLVERIDGNVSLSLNRIPAGDFKMGSDAYSHEGPVRCVRVPQFYLSRHLITQSQWRVVTRLPAVNLKLADNPSYFQGADLPVDSVSWPEAVEFCHRLEALTGKAYRLPTEAEWEYACRAHSDTSFAFGETITAQIVNYDGSHPFKNGLAGSSRQGTINVGSLGIANRFGLYDMHGNLWEWCADEWHQHYDVGAPDDGSAWVTNENPTHRTLRGGSWCNWAEMCRTSERIKGRADQTEQLYYIGFRVALSL
jgi:formylglycine-generating enzyme required for sulfatase activity